MTGLTVQEKKTEKYTVLKKMNGMYPIQKKKLDKSGYVNL